MPKDLSVALTIAGSDSGGGAGIQADMLTFSALGVFGTSAITCLTAQNPGGVSGVQAVSPSFVREQAEQVAAYFKVGALKTGMLFNAGIIEAVAAFVGAHPEIPAVVDPVMVASSGSTLLRADAIAAIKALLLPRARLITPNLDEAAVLLGGGRLTRDVMAEAARELSRAFGTSVLLKGGHLEGGELVDLLVTFGGGVREFHARRIEGVDSHGSGCTLSAAITAGLARGLALEAAVSRAHQYLQRGLASPLHVGGRRYIAHDPR